MKPALRRAAPRLVALLLLALTVAAQPDADRRQAYLDYQLTLARTNQLFPALVSMTKYMLALPDYQTRIVKSMKMSMPESIASMEKDPKAMAILQQNGLTARDYVVGVPVLRMALMAAQGMTGAHIVASPANIAFAKANLATLKAKMDAADNTGVPAK